MTTAIIIGVIVVLACLGIMAWMALTAPEGFEDEMRGFVRGVPEDDEGLDFIGDKN